MSDLSEPGTAPIIPVQRSAAYRGALAAVILLGVLIAIALGVLVAGLVMRFSGHSHAASAPGPVQFTLAPATRLVSAEVSADRLVLRLRGPAGEEIDIIDLESGRLVAKVGSATAPPRR